MKDLESNIDQVQKSISQLMNSLKKDLKVNDPQKKEYLQKLKLIEKENKRLNQQILSTEFIEDLRIQAKDLLVEASHENNDSKKKEILDKAANLIGK